MRNIIQLTLIKINAFFDRYNPIKLTSRVIKLVDYMNQAKYNVKYNTDDIRALKDTEQLILNDIQALQLTIKSIREDYESLKTYHNNLAIEYRDKTVSKIDLNNLNTRINALEVVNVLNKVDKGEVYSDKFDLDDDNITNCMLNDRLLTNCSNDVIKLVNKYHYLVDDKGVGSDNEYFIDDVKRLISKHINATDWVIKNDNKIAQLKSRIENLNSICKVNENLINDNNNKIASIERMNKEYERLLTSDNNYILEEIAKILVAYKGDLIIDDFIDDVNDRFNEFNNIYNDACDDANAKTHHNAHINLTNERGENNAK